MEREPPPKGGTIETDVCVVGGGPAGLAVASVLAGGSRAVLLIESGATAADAESDALNEGACLGDPYAGLQGTRTRQLGGTSMLWNTRTPRGAGGKFTPLAPIDLEHRERVAYSGWPISFEELVPWYERAHDACGFGRFDYHADRWGSPDRTPMDDLGERVATGVYRFGARDDVLGPMLRQVRSAGNVRVVTRATAIELVTDGSERRVVGLRVASRSGEWRVVARHVVLASGAVENARLLLTSGRAPGGLGNRSGWVGRCFMEHPRDTTVTLRPAGTAAFRRLRFYDLFDGGGGALVGGRLAIRDETIRDEGMLNASATLLPVVRSAVPVVRRAVGPLARRPAVQRWLTRGGYGWADHPAPRVVFTGMRVLINLEQAPDPENRIVLSSTRDAHGIPRAELHWRWRARDEASRQRARELFAGALERTGLGTVGLRPAPTDPNAHHHAGTTRMHADPRRGVVDADCRVHELENVFAAGASVFPTAGFANPVLTILALALRLGHHLRAGD